jgi:hypothetical protein
LKAVEQKAGFYTFLGIAIPLVLLTGRVLGDRAGRADAPDDAPPPVAPPGPGLRASRPQWIALLSIGIVLIVGSASLLGWMQNHQRLGNPGVTTVPLADAAPGSLNVKVELPEWVSVYNSVEEEMDPVVVGALPADTSYGQRLYTAPDGLRIQMTAVLMGMDRTSIHKPQFCLVGAGWTIAREEFTTVPIPEPAPYELPVSRITATRLIEHEGQQVRLNGVYVYWFVEEHEITARHEDRMMSMARSMVTKGVLQRWAYISCFVQCRPGQEDFVFDRIQRFMASGVPKFQIPDGTGVAVAPR